MSNFFKRWSDLKQHQTPTKQAPTVPEVEINIQQETIGLQELKSEPVVDPAYQGPTLEDVEKLQPDSDFSSFTGGGVKDEVHQAAMKKLFTDPHYNIMDGLDIYIDDYSIESPMPPGMLEKMVQSSMLGFFKKPTEEESTPTANVPVTPPPHEINEQPQDNLRASTPEEKGILNDQDPRL
jgi:Protein of unknown function (DUF3306)